MHVLFDHSVPAPLSSYLTEHTVAEARDRGWDTLSNGDLLTEAERSGFDVLPTADKNIRYQQNRSGRKIAIVMLGPPQWPVVRLHIERITHEFRYTGQLCRGGHTCTNLSKRVNVAKSIGLAKKLMSCGCQDSKRAAGVTSSMPVISTTMESGPQSTPFANTRTSGNLLANSITPP